PTESSATLYGPWSTWQTARVDITKPAVSALSATPGENGRASSRVSTMTPWLEAKVNDTEGRYVGIRGEVEHDATVPAQGSGRIWSYGSGSGSASGSAVRATVSSGALRDGWLIRWRARGHTPTENSATLYGPWSTWQTAKVDITKPAVSALSATPG